MVQRRSGTVCSFLSLFFVFLTLLPLDPTNASSYVPPRGGASVGKGLKKTIKIAYQGEPGAYSEKSLRELLGQSVISVGRKSFEDCFRAVTSMECDYCLLPVENSLGGSIHENYDLMLRYDLHIVAEHEFRVRHCRIHASKDIKEKDIKFAISHPQALKQCDNYLRARSITPIPTYDTAGSAKMLKTGEGLPPGCTQENTCAIASDLAAETYGLCLKEEGIEDDDSNFTRFLLLSRQSVTNLLSKKTPAKTSVVFTLPESPGALYKALACFSLRDVDFSKIESRPTSASLLSFLKFRGGTRKPRQQPRFRYCFYLDFLDHELSEAAQNSLAHLNEQAQFLRVLGSYPARSKLIGDVKNEVEELRREKEKGGGGGVSITELTSDKESEVRMQIGMLGFNFHAPKLSALLSAKHAVRVMCMGESNRKKATAMEMETYQAFESGKFFHTEDGGKLDVIVINAPLLEIEERVRSLTPSSVSGSLVVCCAPLLDQPTKTLLSRLPADTDVIMCHPMFGPPPSTSVPGVDGLPFVYSKVRVSDHLRAGRFLESVADGRCKMVEMTPQEHDDYTSGSQFCTKLVGNLLAQQNIVASPINPPAFDSLQEVMDSTSSEAFDDFYEFYKMCPGSLDVMRRLRDSLGDLERKLAAKSSYIEARREVLDEDRMKVMEEVKRMLRDIGDEGHGGS